MTGYHGRLMLFDTHAHLHFPDFTDDLDAVLERARADFEERRKQGVVKGKA